MMQGGKKVWFTSKEFFKSYCISKIKRHLSHHTQAIFIFTSSNVPTYYIEIIFQLWTEYPSTVINSYRAFHLFRNKFTFVSHNPDILSDFLPSVTNNRNANMNQMT